MFIKEYKDVSYSEVEGLGRRCWPIGSWAIPATALNGRHKISSS